MIYLESLYSLELEHKHIGNSKLLPDKGSTLPRLEQVSVLTKATLVTFFGKFCHFHREYAW